MTTKNFILNNVKVVVLIFSLHSLCSCIEDYPITINQKYENALVVDGKITNLPGPYTIKLSTATSIEDQSFSPFENATVTISDDEGNTEILSETEPGKYQTTAAGIRGIVGRSYKITIQTKAGKHYESEFEELLAPIGIESLTANLESPYSPNLYAPDLNIDHEDGYQFYVTTASSEKDQNYYWQLDETWEIRSYYKPSRIYDPVGGPNHTGRYYIPASIDTLYYCWKSLENKTYTASTVHLNSSKIINLPLNFVSIHSEMLKYKYSLLLTQFTISENAHNFLNELINQEDGLEGLYTKQPYQIRGNVYNIDNTEDAVLGYFIVASTTESARLTVARPAEIQSQWNMNCEGDDFSIYLGQDLTFKLNQGHELKYLAEVTYTAYGGFSGDIPYLKIDETLPPVECIDCTSRGATTIKPDYWDQ
jgi:hypothetical protein